MQTFLRRLLQAYVVTILVVVGAGTTWLKLSHAQLRSVQTGSMVPVFRAGDALITTPVKPQTIRPGMVVSFLSPISDTVVSHRVVAVDAAHGQFTTKGDRLTKPDTPLQLTSVRGRVVAVLPHLGAVIGFIKRPTGLALFVYLPALAIVVGEIRNLSRHYGRGYYRLVSFR